MNKFAIYYFQFDRNNGSERAYDTTMIGEVNLSKKDYEGLTPKEACEKRIKAELGYAKGRGAEQDIDHIVNFGFIIVKTEREAGADKVLHKYFKNELGIMPLKSHHGTDTEEFNMGEHYIQYINDAVSKCFGKIKPIHFIPRNNQIHCINKMKEVFFNGISKRFLIGAICRFGKTATLLYFFTKVFKLKHILVISAKCDVQKSWQDDFYNFVGNDEYDFLLKKDLLERGLSDKPSIVMVSFQSAAKDYQNIIEDDYEEQIADTDENIKWQQELVKYHWDVVIIDECHFGSDTKRSQNFLNEILKNGNTLKVEVTATFQRKVLRHEYDYHNAFIYDLQDERKDHINLIKDYSKYVPVKFFHLDLYKFQLNNGFDRESRSVEEQLRKKFDACLDDFKFSWESYFSDEVGFSHITRGSHFLQMYKKIFSKYGKHFALFVNKVKHGNKMETALKLTNEFEVINVCGNNHDPLGYINRILNESKKPVIIISCSRYLTASTLKKLHGTILMGTCNSALNYIQFGLRGKNTYEGREYPCTIFDLNTYSFLRTDAFKEMIVAKTGFTGKSIEETLINEYNEKCFEVFELNDYNNFEQIHNFNEQLKNNWFISDDGFGISSLIINEDTITKEYFKEIIDIGIDLHEIKLQEKKWVLTEKQCDKPSKNKKDDIKSKYDKETENDDKEVDYKLWITKLIGIINSIPLYIHLYNPTSLDEIIKDKENSEIFNDFCPKGIEILKTLKNIWISHNEINLWNNLNDAVFSIAKKY